MPGKKSKALNILKILLYATAAIWLAVNVIVSLYGHCYWMIAVNVIGVLVILAVCRKRSAKTLVPILFAFLLLISITMYWGIRNRKMTFYEKDYVLSELENRYGDNRFRIVDSTVRNREFDPWVHFFEFYMFDWSIWNAEVKDDSGVTFNVSGQRTDWDSVSLDEEYELISSIYHIAKEEYTQDLSVSVYELGSGSSQRLNIYTSIDCLNEPIEEETERARWDRIIPKIIDVIDWEADDLQITVYFNEIGQSNRVVYDVTEDTFTYFP